MAEKRRLCSRCNCKTGKKTCRDGTPIPLGTRYDLSKPGYPVDCGRIELAWDCFVSFFGLFIPALREPPPPPPDEEGRRLVDIRDLG